MDSVLERRQHSVTNRIHLPGTIYPPCLTASPRRSLPPNFRFLGYLPTYLGTHNFTRSSNLTSTMPVDARPFVIAVLGTTGTGKTTFTSLASGRTDLKIGHSDRTCIYPLSATGGLSCKNTLVMCSLGTVRPRMVPFSFEGQPVTLIDSPWFGDECKEPWEWATKSDRSEVKPWGGDTYCANLVTYFAAWHRNGMPLDAVIFLYAANSAMHRYNRDEQIGLLEKLVGERAYERVAIVSTKWDRLTNPALPTKLITQRALPGGVWHSLCEGGAVVLHHDNTKNSADDIIRYLVGRFSSQRTQLLIQQELIEHHGKISLTSVGKELERQDAEALTIRAEVLKIPNFQGNFKELDKEVDRRIKERRRMDAVSHRLPLPFPYGMIHGSRP